MRRLEFLFNEARQSTNTTQLASISNLVLTTYVNRVQSFIEDILFGTNPNANIFRQTLDISITPDIDTYDMPTNCYAVNSTLNVSIAWNNGQPKYFTPLDLITEKERGWKRGYFLSGNKIIFSPNPTSYLACVVSYTGKNPSIGLRSGKIKSATATSVKLETGYQTGLTDEADFFCIVDSNGEILQSALPLLGQTLGNLITVGNTILTAGDYVILGKYSTSHSKLPEECEKTILSGLEKMIAYRQSSTDFSMSTVFSDQDVMTIKNVFESSISDAQRPPIVCNQEWVD